MPPIFKDILVPVDFSINTRLPDSDKETTIASFPRKHISDELTQIQDYKY